MSKNSILTACCILVALLGCMPAVAQEMTTPEMADALRADGKIYVVVMVIATIFIGLVLYLFSLDRKISKLEKSSQ